MELILGGINGKYLRNITERSAKDTESVEAAVAYASEASLLFDWCIDHEIPLKFWGRYDDTVPISLPILKKFLERKSANFVCKVVKHLHAKVIWWKGVGVYVGSANLSHRAWYQNIEAGCFFDETEITALEMEADLYELFRVIDEHSSPLTSELVASVEVRVRELSALKERDSDAARQFSVSHIVQQWSGLKHVQKKSADQTKKEAFLKEWWETLQIIRNIGLKISTDENRPSWIRSNVPIGAQADQFLHAHYYHRTFDGRKANYEKYFNENKKDPEVALDAAIEWWRSLSGPPSREDRTLNEWAPFLKIMLAQPRLLSLTSEELMQVCGRVHAIQDHARRIPNHVVGLPDGRKYSMEEKTEAFSRFLYAQKSAQGKSVLETLAYVLDPYDSDRTPLRLWEAVSNPKWEISHLGISALGELIGWGLPDTFPARNGRTSKALRSLGYPVTVHVM